MDKIIVLDIDGVLNFSHFRYQYGHNTIAKDCVEPLFYILERTGAKIVISSTWRCDHIDINSFKEEFKSVLEKCGIGSAIINKIIGSIIGMTLDFNGLDRGAEIKEWIEENEFNGRFAIIDDEEDLFEYKENLFLTCDDSVGLTWEIADRVIEHLKFGD